MTEGEIVGIKRVGKGTDKGKVQGETDKKKECEKGTKRETKGAKEGPVTRGSIHSPLSCACSSTRCACYETHRASASYRFRRADPTPVDSNLGQLSAPLGPL